MARHDVTAALAAGLLLAACGPNAPDNFPHGIPDPCPGFPEVTIGRCLDKGWVVEQASAMSTWCGDLLVNSCYDRFIQEQEAFGAGACDDYWKPCLLESDCPASAGDKPATCHQITMSLFPTYLQANGYINPNLVGLACSKVIIPPKPQLTMPAGKPLMDGLTDRLELRTNPTWQEQTVGQVSINQASTMPTSASMPAPSAPSALPGQRSLNIFKWNQACNGTGTIPTIADKRYTVTEAFLNPFKTTESEIAGLSDCSNYVLNKYYDWAVFQMRMLPESSAVMRTPAILRVRAAFATDLRGNLGRLALENGPMSRSYFPAQHSVGPNRSFPLWDTRSRAANPFDEFLTMSARVSRPSTPQDHRHRFLFSNPVLAAKSAPAYPPEYPTVAQVNVSWNWHASALQKYENQHVTPTDEKWFRLRRIQFLELVVRRAQLEVASALAGHEVNLLAATTLMTEPSLAVAHQAWWLNLRSGILEPTLESLTNDERSFVKAHYAQDFQATLDIYAKLTAADVEARLKSIDELIESDLTRTDERTNNTLIATCLTLDTPAHSVMCEWLPEMFTDAFVGVTETDLLAIPPKEPPADFPLAGPEADKRKCESYTRGLNFSRLNGQFAFKCPLNSSVMLNGVDTSRFEVCTCDKQGSDWLCGKDKRLNTEAGDLYPVFYDPDSYLSSLDKFEGFFTRTDEMNGVAFAVATAFIPACSDAPIMTEVHTKKLELGNGTFGATMTKNFYWSKNAKDDTGDLLATFNLEGTVLGIPMPFMEVSANASKTPGANETAGASVKVAGLDVPWSAENQDSGSLGDISGSFYFAIGPVPCSVHYGVKGDWKAHTTARIDGTSVTLFASASAGARLYVEGGVDIGIAGVGLGVDLELFHIGPVFDSSLGMRKSPPGQSPNQSDSIDLKSKLVLNTSLLSGRFYAWAEIGICPFCESFDVTLFDWSGFHFTTPVWSRELRLTERNLDKLQGWTRPPGCQ